MRLERVRYNFGQRRALCGLFSPWCHDVLLLIVLLPLLLGTIATAWAGSRARMASAWLAAAVTASSLGLLLSMAPRVMGGEGIRQAWSWVPEIGLTLTTCLYGAAVIVLALLSLLALRLRPRAAAA